MKRFRDRTARRVAGIVARSRDTAFDAYLMVDWSAAGRPVRGKDSVWWTLYAWDGEALRCAVTSNPATRARAEAEITTALLELVGANRSVLVGFDFPFGYPAGFARLLGLEPRALTLWDELAEIVEDGEDNRSNRFVVASRMNERASGGPAPLWGWDASRGAPPPYLAATKPRRRPAGLEELRQVDGRIRGPKSAFQLWGAGCVGSQAILGLPRVRSLLYHPDLAAHSTVWPFLTGAGLPGRGLGPRVVHAEVYPSMFELSRTAGEVKDQAQVRAAATWFAAADAAGTLAPLFEAPRQLPAPLIQEEGWILGVR